jgi:hypothetical protein
MPATGCTADPAASPGPAGCAEWLLCPWCSRVCGQRLQGAAKRPCALPCALREKGIWLGVWCGNDHMAQHICVGIHCVLPGWEDLVHTLWDGTAEAVSTRSITLPNSWCRLQPLPASLYATGWAQQRLPGLLHARL